jgi:hypothetical protein
MSDENSAVLHAKIFVLKIIVDQDVAGFHVVPLVGGETSNDLEVREMPVCPFELLTSCPTLIKPEPWHTGQNNWLEMPNRLKQLHGVAHQREIGVKVVMRVDLFPHAGNVTLQTFDVGFFSQDGFNISIKVGQHAVTIQKQLHLTTSLVSRPGLLLISSFIYFYYSFGFAMLRVESALPSRDIPVHPNAYGALFPQKVWKRF